MKGEERRGDGGKFQAEEECSVDLWGCRPTHELNRIQSSINGKKREGEKKKKKKKKKKKRVRKK